MTVFNIPEENIFPKPELAEEDGLLGIGGDLSPERLINAYANGIFPWYSDDQPILWWSPNPRLVLFPKDFKRNKSLRKTVEKGIFEVGFDNNFEQVIRNCSKIKRNDQDSTWITEDMINAYINLHELGFAHSVETYFNNELVGGLYGISIGKAFFGESMFHKKTDASKVALWHLIDKLLEWNFDFIDAQQETDHLKSLGAIVIKRENFLNLLEIAIGKDGKIQKWNY
jgi:leucyl/phenylalanyl-tRNA--protein transferase